MDRGDLYKNRQFNIVFAKVAVTAAQDLIEIVAPLYTGAELRLINLKISQSSDKGDTEAEMKNILIHKGSTAGSGGSVVTPRPLNHSHEFTGTAARNNTSQSTEGEHLWSESFNIMAGLDNFWEKDSRDEVNIKAGERLIIELQDAPDDSLTMSVTVKFEINKLL